MDQTEIVRVLLFVFAAYYAIVLFLLGIKLSNLKLKKSTYCGVITGMAFNRKSQRIIFHGSRYE